MDGLVPNLIYLFSSVSHEMPLVRSGSLHFPLVHTDLCGSHCAEALIRKLELTNVTS